MADVFISHVEEDMEVALEIASGLEAAGYTAWTYGRDSYPGIDYLDQVDRAILECQAVLVLISPTALGSEQVEDEVKWAREHRKRFVPVLKGISWAEFHERRPKWRMAIGIAAAVSIPAGGVAAILPRVVRGLQELGVNPHAGGLERQAALEREGAKAEMDRRAAEQAEAARKAREPDEQQAPEQQGINIAPLASEKAGAQQAAAGAGRPRPGSKYVLFVAVIVLVLGTGWWLTRYAKRAAGSHRTDQTSPEVSSTHNSQPDPNAVTDWTKILFNDPILNNCQNSQPCVERRQLVTRLKAMDFHKIAKGDPARKDCAGWAPCLTVFPPPRPSTQQCSTPDDAESLPAKCPDGDDSCKRCKEKWGIPETSYP